MDREISAIVKSKSSNDGKFINSSNKKKKYVSDAEFTPNLVKKQRSYDKTLKPVLRTDVYPTRRKAPPRPRPGQKKFLASVLTILSKSTTGTQYPDVKDEKINKRANKRDRDTKTEKPRKQSKYKSKVLSRYTDRNDQLIVLQSRKDIAQTPSNYSEANNSQNEEPKRSIRHILDNNIRSAVDEGLVNNREKKIRINDEPETLASKTAEEDKKFYNLFVDLLETTFNNYNLNNDALSDTNIALEINESVAKKLTIKNDFDTSDITLKPTRDPIKELKPIRPIDNKLSERKTTKYVKPRVSIKPFVQTNKFDIPETYSFPSKRKVTKNRRKMNLLNIFREELKLKPTFEGPPNWFLALKVMAKNKKIKYTNEKPELVKTRIGTDDFDPKCKLRRRRIISMNTKRFAKDLESDKVIQKYSSYKSKFQKREKLPLPPSTHSLEVFEYNYEEPEKYRNVHRNRQQSKEYGNRNTGVPAKPSPFVMKSNLDYYTLLKFPDRSTYDFTY